MLIFFYFSLQFKNKIIEKIKILVKSTISRHSTYYLGMSKGSGSGLKGWIRMLQLVLVPGWLIASDPR